MPEEHSIKLREPDHEALSDPELVDSVAGMLADITGDSAEDVGAATPNRHRKNPLAKKEPEPEDLEEEYEEEEFEEEEEGEPTEPTLGDSKEAEDKSGEDEEARPIPESYYRSAVHSGWSEEQVNDIYDKLGHDDSMALLQDLHQKDNNLTAQFSELGRRAKELEQPDNTGAPVAPVVAHHNAEPAQAQPQGFNLAEIQEKYKDDPIVGYVAQQANSIQQLTGMLNELKSQLANTRQDVSAQQAEADRQAEKDINGFFAGMKQDAYTKFYGEMGESDTNWLNLSPAQRMNRDAVCAMVGDILDGARFNNRQMTLDEALQRAHQVVSAPIAESVLRQKIMGEVEKRSKSRVVRPSKSKKKGTTETTHTGKARNKQETLARAHERLSALGLTR